MNDIQTLKYNLVIAINACLLGCRDKEQLALAEDMIVEFFCAIGMEDHEYVQILQNCGGFDRDSDDLLDKLIEEFSDESL